MGCISFTACHLVVWAGHLVVVSVAMWFGWVCVCMVGVSVFGVCWWFGVLVGLRVLSGLDRSLVVWLFGCGVGLVLV